MICPKCHKPNKRYAKECEHCNVVFADIRNAETSDDYDHQCQWNDHGVRCDRYGHLSPTTGKGTWYCEEHYCKLRGYTWPAPAYRPIDKPSPPIVNCPPFRSVGSLPGDSKLKGWTALHGRQPHQREPGEDEGYVQP